MKGETKKELIQNTALIQRSLTLSSKSFLQYFLRIVLPIIFIIILTDVDLSRKNNLGLPIMQFIAAANILIITFCALFTFCPVISSERESETLTLLKLTPLHPASILIGKLAGPYINMLFFMLTQLPFILLAVTLGGVSVIQIIQVYFVLIMYMTSLAALALFCSVRNPENWLSGFNFCVIGGIAYLGTAMLFWFGFRSFEVKVIGEFLLYNSTWMVCMNVLSPAASTILWHFLINGLVALMFMYFSLKSFDPYEESQLYNKPDNQSKEEKKRKSHRITGMPVASKDSRFTFGGLPSQIIIFAAMVLVILFAIMTVQNSKWDPPAYIKYFKIFFPMQLMICLAFFIHYAGYSLKSELVNNTMESLILSPITGRQILVQKMAGILKFMKPQLAVLGLALLVNPMVTFPFIWNHLTSYKGFWLALPGVLLLASLAQLLQVYKITGKWKAASAVTLLITIIPASVFIFLPFFGSMDDSTATVIAFTLIVSATAATVTTTAANMTHID